MPPPSPHDLSLHGEFLRRLALSLLGSPDLADDAVQETMLVTLRREPRAGVGLRPWLGGVLKNVVRNLRRGQRRRRAHEERAPARASLAPEAIREREALRARLLNAVLALPDPLRETVLLRFDQDLPAREVARRTASPVSTVHDRLRRGLALLRERLDEDLDPRADGASPAARTANTRAALLAFVHALPTAGGGALGGLLLGKAWIAAAALLLALGGATLWTLGGDRAEHLPTGDSAAAAPAADSGGAPGLARASSPERRAETPSPSVATVPGVFGRVEDARTGRPVPGARVESFAFDIQAALPAATSDAEGRFDLEGARGREGALYVVVRHPEYAAATLGRLVPAREGLRVALTAASWIVGRLAFDAASGPHRGEVRLQALAYVTGAGLALAEWERDLRQLLPMDLRPGASAQVGEGGFRLGPLVGGRYALALFVEGHPPLEVSGANTSEAQTGIDVPPGATVDLGEVRLPPPTRVTLQVLDGETDAPVPGVRFSAAHEIDRAEVHVPLHATPAEPAGSWSVSTHQHPPLIQGALLRVEAPGYGFAESAYVNHFDERPLVVRLYATATLEGTLTSENGRPLGGALVVVRTVSGRTVVTWTTTDATGTYRLPTLPSRTDLDVALLLAAAEEASAVAALNLRPRETRRLNLGGAGATTLHGTITRGGVPLADAIVSLKTPDESSARLPTRLSGRFHFAGIPPGRQRLAVWSAATQESVQVEVEVAPGQSLLLPLALEQVLAGRVEEHTLAGAAVEPPRATRDYRIGARRTDARGWRWLVEAPVSKDGSFELRLPVTGGSAATWLLAVESEDAVTLRPLALPLPRAPDAPRVVVPVALDPRDGRIEIAIIDAETGEPAAGATYHGASNSWGNSWSTSGTLGGNAILSSDAASLGEYVYSALAPRHVRAEVRVEITASQRSVRRELRLERSNAVRILVLETPGNASDAGLKPGDLLVRHGERSIRAVADLHEATSAAPTTETLDIEFWRDGALERVRVRGGRLGVAVENARVR